ncbi:hypothetical protein [Kaistella jeonii]|uniref:Uncharacterized protein n=1 Tax=Kaistella jeonii TaxID=266749 RepID=A0A0C1FDQ3_9FLAO|nr:hypothetical protein [Kaistella jeonii]KIA89958.1 hypothetical protein OA86_04975 [Kaistella jeonii]SFB80326.1 hypothetical protein SAMN05421876_102301 [Kaistella jeonii]VEI96214.1 Uncharacterised protein [Kaistella jeonii]
MVTIKEINLENSDHQSIENSFRKYSIRKGKMIEFASNSGYQKIADKFFFANENDRYFEATRIKYPFENILPRLILKIDKNNFHNIKIRFSIISGIYFLFLYIILLVFLGLVIFKNNFNGDISIILILILIQFITTVIEYKLSLKIIKRII